MQTELNVLVKELNRFCKIVLVVLILPFLLSNLFYLLFLAAQENQGQVLYIISMQSNLQPDLMNRIKLVNRLLYLNHSVYWVAEPLNVTFEGEKYTLVNGDFIIPFYQTPQNDPFSSFLSQSYMERIFDELNVPIIKVYDNVEAYVYPLKHAKVAVFYGGGVTGSALEHILPLEDAGFSVGIIREENLYRGDPFQYDILIFPGGGPYDKYLSQENMEAIKDFVNRGGGFLGTCGGSVLGIKLGLLDAEAAVEGPYEAYADLRGPLLLNLTTSKTPIVSGYSSTVETMYFGGPFISKIGSNVETVGSYYSKTDNLMAYFPEIASAYNYTPQTEIINDFWGTPAIIAGKYGSGKVVLSAVHPEVLAVSQRLFVNSIYYLVSDEELLFSSTSQHTMTQKVSKTNQSNEALGILNENTWSQLRNSLSTLRDSASYAREVLAGQEKLNAQLVGVAGEYLQLFLGEIQNRSTKLLTKMDELRYAYGNLQSAKALLEQRQPIFLSHLLTCQNSLFSIEKLQRRILSLQESILNVSRLTYIMNAINEELQDERSLLQRIASENLQDSQRYQEIIYLHALESLTLVKLKDEVDRNLLNWTFEAGGILLEADLLNYALSLNN